jgi:hypothetical protein
LVLLILRRKVARAFINGFSGDGMEQHRGQSDLCLDIFALVPFLDRAPIETRWWISVGIFIGNLAVVMVLAWRDTMGMIPRSSVGAQSRLCRSAALETAEFD